MASYSPPPQFMFINSPTQLNVVYILVQSKSINSSTIQQNTSMAIIGIAISFLFDVMQIKYQSQDSSPFQTHPKTMFIALSTLLLYCFGCDTEHSMSSICRFSTWSTLIHINFIRFLGFTSVASLVSIILSTSSANSVNVYLVLAFFFLGRCVLSWIQNRNSGGIRGGYPYSSNLQTSIHIPYIHAFSSDINTLPV